jgi:hypothetical protein
VRRTTANTVIAVAALFTSVLAVIVSWDEARLLRRSQEATFRPIIEIDGSIRSRPDDLAIALTLSNSGNGVAYLEGLELSFDGEVIETWPAFEEAILTDALGDVADMSWATAEGFYKPGEERTVLLLRWPETEKEEFLNYTSGEGIERFSRFNAVACFCSVFDRCWEVRMNGDDKPTDMRACRQTTDPIETLWTGYLAARREGETS